MSALWFLLPLAVLNALALIPSFVAAESMLMQVAIALLATSVAYACGIAAAAIDIRRGIV